MTDVPTTEEDQMTRKHKGSPRIVLEITDSDRAAAIASNSGGCLIADALKRAGWQNPSVDMATIRVTDPETGMRYVYLTSPIAQHLLLGFDQGWPVDGTVEIRLQRAVKIVPITASRPRSERRAARLLELEEKLTSGQVLSRDEKTVLTKLRKLPVRPTTEGRTKIASGGTVIGGSPIPQGPAHPNLLRGRNRIYGAKLADPGEAFEQAVAAAVRERERKE